MVIRPFEGQTKESARRGASLSTVYCVAFGRLLFGSKTSVHVPSVFVNICHESYHLLQKQLLPLTIDPSAGHVIKYYKSVLGIMYIAVCIKKLLKTSKFEIIVRRGGSLAGSVPSGSNSNPATA